MADNDRGVAGLALMVASMAYRLGELHPELAEEMLRTSEMAYELAAALDPVGLTAAEMELDSWGSDGQ